MEVPVHTTADIFFAVIDMKCQDLPDTYEAIKFPNCFPIPFFRTDVISGGKGVAGVEADAQALGVMRLLQDLGYMFETITDGCSLTGCIFEKQLDGWLNQIERSR